MLDDLQVAAPSAKSQVAGADQEMALVVASEHRERTTQLGSVPALPCGQDRDAHRASWSSSP